MFSDFYQCIYNFRSTRHVIWLGTTVTISVSNPNFSAPKDFHIAGTNNGKLVKYKRGLNSASS
jgi:hypothetical protein